MHVAVAAAVVGVLALGGILFLPISDEDPEVIEVSMVEYAFDPAGAQAAPGQDLAISNDGDLPHSYVIVDLGKGVELQPGEERTIQLPSDAELGTYRVICDIPGHIDAGMVGTIELR
jgi:uncharacterized cupredoxin-like copper-binding protein